LLEELIVQVRNLGFQKSLFNKIAKLAGRLEQAVESELRVSFGLTLSQFRVLEVLANIGQATQREIAQAVGVTPAVVTRQAEVLAARGLLTQRPNPRSRRENLLELSPKGEEAVLSATKSVISSQQDVFKDIDLQSETSLNRILDSLVKAA
jgi:DNA-binding MarR family transcriptional regulator